MPSGLEEIFSTFTTGASFLAVGLVFLLALAAVLEISERLPWWIKIPFWVVFLSMLLGVLVRSDAAELAPGERLILVSKCLTPPASPGDPARTVELGWFPPGLEYDSLDVSTPTFPELRTLTEAPIKVVYDAYRVAFGARVDSPDPAERARYSALVDWNGDGVANILDLVQFRDRLATNPLIGGDRMRIELGESTQVGNAHAPGSCVVVKEFPGFIEAELHLFHRCVSTAAPGTPGYLTPSLWQGPAAPALPGESCP